MNRFIHLVALLALCSSPAVANDSTAESAAGGLVLRNSDTIDMVSEDLFVSVDEVRVAYVFHNQSGADIDTIVAFPMPDRDLEAMRVSNVAFPRDFVTMVDGAPVATEIELRAVRNGTDYTDLLAELDVPLTWTGPEDAVGTALDSLPPAQQQRLLDLDLVAVDEYDQGNGMERHLWPLWTVRETRFWTQTFPAGRDLAVTHQYVPGAGGSVGTGLAYPDFRASPEGREMIAASCIDADFMAGLDRMIAAGGEYPLVGEQTVGYVLTTGANWRAPIHDFRLVVDKGDPANIVSFCGEGVRKISPTRFEVRHTDWRPDRDLQVLILVPPAVE